MLVDPEIAAAVATRFGVDADAVFPAAPLQAGLYFQSLFDGADEADPYTAQGVWKDVRIEPIRVGVRNGRIEA